MIGDCIVRYLEQNFSPKVPKHTLTDKPTGGGLRDGQRVAIIGGGIAGSAFARQLLLHAQKENRNIEVVMVNSTNCNYCGGLVTPLARQALQDLYNLELPDYLVLKWIQNCLYINASGSAEIKLHTPMAGILRTSRFGLVGFDDHFKENILQGIGDSLCHNFVSYEPTIVTKISRLPDKKWVLCLSKKDANGKPINIKADVLVMAGGIRALHRPMMQEFTAISGYHPPPTMTACVTEIDTTKAVYNYIGDRMVIVDNIIPGGVVALIPKGPWWMTLTCLGVQLKKEDLATIFDHPSIKEYIYLPNAEQSAKCHTICPAKVFTGSSHNFYGDGWLCVGDMTGYGRVLKDGYFAAFLEGALAAQTLIYHGSDKTALRKQYHMPLQVFDLDNSFGMLLFKLNCRIQGNGIISRLLVKAAHREGHGNPYGGWVHGGIRALASGEMTYRLISLCFIFGLLGQAVVRPVETLRLCWQKGRRNGN